MEQVDDVRSPKPLLQRYIINEWRDKVQMDVSLRGSGRANGTGSCRFSKSSTERIGYDEEKPFVNELPTVPHFGQKPGKECHFRQWRGIDRNISTDFQSFFPTKDVEDGGARPGICYHLV
jgi:hypothetical protein